MNIDIFLSIYFIKSDLFCRLPLSTLFYRSEAANLGDLMRLWVRPKRDISDLDFQGSNIKKKNSNMKMKRIRY